MGCFSFLCSECGDQIRSNSFSGEFCILFLLENGEIREWMQGEYDSYGRVFKSSTTGMSMAPGEDPWGEVSVSQRWDSMEWRDVCRLMHNGDADSGIAAYHIKCWHGGHERNQPEVSINDPNQGWGDDADSDDYKHPRTGGVGEFAHAIRDPRIVWKAAEPPIL
jgi:hypothetical protein